MVLLKPRWRIMIVFACLASTFCILFGTAVHNMFYSRLTDALDDELSALSDELGAFVNLADDKSDLEAWKSTKPDSMLRSVVSVALYNANGKRLETYGNYALPSVAPSKTEFVLNGQRVRLFSKQVGSHGQGGGWLQITVPTRARDRALEELTELMKLALPAVLFVFIVAGYFFSGWAMKPIEKAFSSHKRFMSDASHELKTPLTIAQTHCEALEAELGDQQVTSPRIGIIRAAHTRIHRLIEDLLLLTQTESESSTQIVDGVSINQMVLSVVEDFREKYKGKNIELRCNADKDAVAPVRCDPEMMRRAIVNLVENAWKYTDEGGSVTVSVAADRLEVKVAVEDTGTGIDPDALPFLFDRFYRVDKSRSRKEGGSGLGLSIVRAIVEAQGGRVFVQSELGKGSKFTITLHQADA